MSGFTKSTLIFGPIAFVLYAAVTPFGVGWCTPFFAIVLGLAVGYVGSTLSHIDVAKTALIARGGLRAGLMVGVAGLLGQLLGALLSPFDGISWLMSCAGVVAVLVSGFFGWLGGWSWSRHQHERQTGYKPT